MNRRQFTKNSLCGAAVIFMASVTSILTSGCNFVQDLIDWVPVGLNALNGIVALLSGAGVIPAPVLVIIGLIKAGFADLIAALQEYESDTNPADKASNLAKIETFFNDLVTNFNQFLASLTNSPLVGVIAGLVSIILSTLSALVEKINPTSAALAKAKLMPRVAITSVKIHWRNSENIKDFRNSWNGLCASSGHKEAQI
jgi:hypothetical protein